MGNALPSGEIPENYESKLYPGEIRDGPCVTIVFPRSKTLRNTEGKVLATAKWVGIYWNRGNGKPDIVYYGNTPYKIEGGFEVPDGIIPLPPPEVE